MTKSNVTIRRVCQMCNERFVDGLPACECCPACGGVPKGDYACDKCIPARDACKDAVREIWKQHLKEVYNV